MNKKLEALERIKPFKFVNKQEELDYVLIEKTLKALEIIKEKQVDIHWLKGCKELEEYNDCANPWEKELTQEEYDLLREVLL